MSIATKAGNATKAEKKYGIEEQDSSQRDAMSTATKAGDATKAEKIRN